MSPHSSYKNRNWSTQPAAETLLRQLLDERLGRCPPARQFGTALLAGTGVRLRDILDHMTFDDDLTVERIERAGWVGADGVWEHPGGYFPAFVRRSGPLTSWFRVENADLFAARHGPDAPIEGVRYGPARRLVAFTCDQIAFGALERAGHSGYDIPAIEPGRIRAARIHLQSFTARRRQFDTVEQGLAHTETLAEAAVADLGADWACDLWLRAERNFWMSRCRAGRRQKERQDALGIGWANIDHHTYDSSRRHYRHTIRILETLGYQLREMLYAGELAGWGSQVLEQPTLKSTIFADVDLAPEELAIDFAHEELPELPQPRRAGVLSFLHGESILEAGLNHVAGLYDRRVLQGHLRAEGIEMMSPFSDFDHLYQELTHGDWAAVDPRRVDQLEADGHLPADEAEQIRLNGAIVAHLENIERNDGYKGFNRDGIDGVLRKLDPRAYDAAEVGAAAP
ncbi:hypothetical protein [Sphingomonas sp. URHD0057]|uniref:hypothetical protein n=1 Tax=Sphingomonas sp. URHD0057 TaxID=1380389 RepID=UPI000A4B4879|nr:hypothetical protein [Sphingomonas sp. URHD0057]